MKQLITHSLHLGQILTARRKALGLSQRDVATKLGISQNRLSEIESDPAPLAFDRLLDLAGVLGFDVVVEDRKPAKPSKGEW